MEWTQEDVIILIDLFYGKPVLWNQKLSRNKILQSEAIYEISLKLSRDPKEIERKLNYLRTQFSRELLRVRRSKINNEDYEPKWFAFKPLSFLIYKSGQRNKIKQDKETEGIFEQSIYFTSYERKLLAAIENTNDNPAPAEKNPQSENSFDNTSLENNENKISSNDVSCDFSLELNKTMDNSMNQNYTVNEIKYPIRRRSTRKSIRVPIKEEVHIFEPNHKAQLISSETSNTSDNLYQSNINTPKNHLSPIEHPRKKTKIEKNNRKYRNPVRPRNFDLINAKLKFVMLQKKFLLQEHEKKEKINELQLEHEKYKLELTKLEVEKKKIEIQIRNKMI